MKQPNRPLRAASGALLVALSSIATIAFAGCGGADASGQPQKVAYDASTSGDVASSDAIDDTSSGASDGAPDTTTSEVASDGDGGGDVGDAGAASPDYEAPGPHPTTTLDATVSGNAVHCLVPNDAPPAAGLPAVAFAHGFQLPTNGYDQLLTHLASWGYVACSTDYPGTIFSIDHRDVAAALSALRAAMAGGTISGLPKVDGAHVAASGHSLGGKGAVMAVLADPAFAAAFTLDPVDGNPSPGGTTDAAHPQLTPTQTAKLTVPMGYVGATQSHCTASTFGATPCAPTGLDAAAFYAGTPSTIPRYLWTVWDFGHMQFLDNPSCGFTCSVCVAGQSPVGPRKAAVRATFVAFLERHLRGDAGAKTWLDGARRAQYVTAQDFWDGVSALPPCN